MFHIVVEQNACVLKEAGLLIDKMNRAPNGVSFMLSICILKCKYTLITFVGQV